MIDLPTPETDALFWRNGYPVEVDSSKAMQLCEKLEQERDWITEKFKLLEGCFKRAERERDEAREAIHALKRDREEWELLREAQHDRIVGEFAKVYAERDEAREQVKDLIYIAERAIDLAEIDFENDKFGVVSELRSDLEKIKKSK